MGLDEVSMAQESLKDLLRTRHPALGDLRVYSAKFTPQGALHAVV